jgi:pilus assembly protein Flp/PilA
MARPTRGLQEFIVRRIMSYLAGLTPVRSEAGVTAVEYGLILALIAIAIVTTVSAVGANISGVLNRIATTV